jgi:uncharacterized protein YjdB
MQLFSRNKAIVALSLGALALGACGDDVTVPVAPAAPVVVTITPPSALMNIGEALNFAVQISGGSATAAPTLTACAVTPTTVATATVAGSACRVTAVAAGNATVTATASTGQIAAASIAVSAPAPAITSLAVSPSAQQLVVGASVTLVPTVQPAGRTATFTYTSSSATIASVTAAGVVTAVAPGTATITVAATGSGTGFSTATINQAVTITVSDRAAGLTTLNVQPSNVSLSLGATQQLTSAVQGPRASAATISYLSSAPTVASVSATGVVTAVAAGTAVIGVTASSMEAGAFAASSITALVPVTVSPAAQVVISSLTRAGGTIDISNVTDQIEVNLGIQPNGQNISEVNVWVCAPADTVAQCAMRTNGVPAARQSFSAAGAQQSNVQLYINTSEFGTPNFTTGDDANTLYKNGLRTIVATLTTSPNAASTIASNSISQVNFNNPDGWTIQWTAPANRANSVANITWYGGPSTPDALTPNAASGTGSFTVVPVIYTPGRTVAQAVLNMTTSCGGNITDRSRPFRGTYGTATRDTLGVVFNCSTASTVDGTAPTVVSAVDNNNNGYAGTTLSPAVARSIFDDFTTIASSTSGGYRQSLAYRPNFNYLPHDYAAPSITRFDVNRGTDGSAAWSDSAWVNGAYWLAGANPLSSLSTLRYTIADAEVGLLSDNGTGSARPGAATRNTLFSVCALAAIPTTTPTAPLNCTSPVATGGIASTVSSMNIVESVNLTNAAYFAQVAETDRLGNRATSVVYSWDNGLGSSAARTPSGSAYAGAGQYSAAVFGVDLQGPMIVAIPNDGPDAIANFARLDRDSIYATTASGLNTDGAIAAEAAVFAVRFTDSRSGFPTCSATNCLTATAGTVRGGNFQITRRTAPAVVLASNDALVDLLINGATAANRTVRNSINAGEFAGDASIREFSIPIASIASTRNNATVLPLNIGTAVDGYYTFSGTLTDRAGNSVTIPPRTVAVDNSSPLISSLNPTGVYTGGSTVSFTPTASDALEVISADLALTYGQLGKADGTAGAATQPTVLRFNRVPAFANSGNALLGLWHNPFQSLTDNKLASAVGAGTTLGSSLTLPIPFIQQLITVDGSFAPIAPATYAAYTDLKPSAASAGVYDIRSTSTQLFTDLGLSAADAVVPISEFQVPTSTKNWTTAPGGAGIQTWTAFNPSAGGPLEFRVRTSSSVTNAPFTRVHVIRAGATQWEFLGTATFAGTLDQGGNRFFRYTFTFAGVNQGQFTQAALTNGDVVRALGVDGSGNALSTLNVTFGLADAIPFGETVFNAPLLPLTIANAEVPANTTLALSGNPNSANVVYSCSSNSAFLTAAMTSPTQCTVTSAGVVLADVPVTVTFTATGSALGYTTNSVSSTVSVTRIVVDP